MTDAHADGANLRDEGTSLAQDAQDATAPGWSERAYAAIVAVACRADEIHRDDVCAVFTEDPEHFNAWGAVWLRALRDRVIAPAGKYRRSRDRKKHAHVYPVYRSLVRRREDRAYG